MSEDKHPGGRPPKFSTPEELEARIEEYFALLKVDDEDKDPNEHIDDTPTITGLAFYLGFVDRRSMYDYEQRPEFSHAIKNARARIENWYEKNLLKGNTAGCIFALKNVGGWRDKIEQEITGKDGQPVVMPTVIEIVAPDDKSED